MLHLTKRADIRNTVQAWFCKKAGCAGPFLWTCPQQRFVAGVVRDLTSLRRATQCHFDVCRAFSHPGVVFSRHR
jgi:hypothetical protein